MQHLSAPRDVKVRRQYGVADTYVVGATYTVSVYEDGEFIEDQDGSVSFWGTIHGGGPIMLAGASAQFTVTEPERFGDFTADPEAWVLRFIGAE